jgi:hypothetical protein
MNSMVVKKCGIGSGMQDTGRDADWHCATEEELNSSRSYYAYPELEEQ